VRNKGAEKYGGKRAEGRDANSALLHRPRGVVNLLALLGCSRRDGRMPVLRTVRFNKLNQINGFLLVHVLKVYSRNAV
jgi:hypothetical protein